MEKLKFRPRVTFNADLKRLGCLDPTIVDEVRAAIEMLLETGTLPDEYGNHSLQRRLAGYREFHAHDTPQGELPSDINDVLVIWYRERNDLVAVGVRIGSHERLFPHQNRSKKYRKD